MFLIIVFRKSFKNIILVPFFELFGHEHKFETWFENFLGKLLSIFEGAKYKHKFLFPKLTLSHILVHAIDKHYIYIVVKTFQVKGLGKWFGCF
jgi:hypothetical protein